jgi:putative sigma-54 modulation protein
MKLQVHSIHFDADQKLISFIQRKVDKLETFYDRIIDGEVFLKLEKNGVKENKITEVKINIPGSQFFAKEQSQFF